MTTTTANTTGTVMAIVFVRDGPKMMQTVYSNIYFKYRGGHFPLVVNMVEC